MLRGIEDITYPLENEVVDHSNAKQWKAYDWAVLRINPLWQGFALPHAPPPQWWTLPAIPISFESFYGSPVQATGYPCGGDPEIGLGGWTNKPRPDGALYETDALPEAVLHDVWLDPAPPENGNLLYGGGVLRGTWEGAGGMSGGPVWSTAFGPAKLLGINEGSIEEECLQGINWACALTQTTVQRIIAAMTAHDHATLEANGLLSTGVCLHGGGFSSAGCSLEFPVGVLGD